MKRDILLGVIYLIFWWGFFGAMYLFRGSNVNYLEFSIIAAWFGALWGSAYFKKININVFITATIIQFLILLFMDIRTIYNFTAILYKLISLIGFILPLLINGTVKYFLKKINKA